MFAFKLKFNSEVRRVTLSELDFNTLSSRIAKLFPELANGAKITFYDRNNVIAEVKSNADLCVASQLGYSTTLTLTAPTNKIVPMTCKASAANLHLELMRAVTHFNKPLRHVPTREVTHAVVGVKEPKARQVGKVLASKNVDWQKRYQDNINQLLWTRVRYGPSAIENPQIRKRIAQGNFKLRHVETVVKMSPIVGNEEFCRQVKSFKKTQLRPVTPRVSIFKFETKSKKASLTQALKSEIVSSPAKIQLNHVNPKVSYKPVVRHDIVAVQREINNQIKKFNHKNLRPVQTRFSNSPIEVVAAKVNAAPTSAPTPTSAQKIPTPPPAPVVPSSSSSVLSQGKAMQFHANLKSLEEIGFVDRKRCISALIQSNNNLEEAVIVLVGA